MKTGRRRPEAFKIDLWKKELKEKEELLKLYNEQEKKILEGQAQAYNIGSRSVTKYSADLSTVRNNINEIENRIKELNYLINGYSLRAVRHAVPRDR